MATTRILLVDDERLVRETLMRILADYPDVEVVGQATSGDEPFQVWKHFNHKSWSWTFACPKWMESLRRGKLKGSIQKYKYWR
jgi:DNA-binding LytR/AlgR family response regulator